MSRFDPANDNDRPYPQERRCEPRRRVLLTGKIVYPGNSLTADCTIRDLSPRGARISTDTALASNDPYLIVVKHAVVCPSRTAWRRDSQSGLRFMETVDLHGKPPPRARRARNIWVELASH